MENTGHSENYFQDMRWQCMIGLLSPTSTMIFPYKSKIKTVLEILV